MPLVVVTTCLTTCCIFALVPSLSHTHKHLGVMSSKYKLMESNMDKAKQSMKDKVPEIERSLDLVKHLQERQVCMIV